MALAASSCFANVGFVAHPWPLRVVLDMRELSLGCPRCDTKFRVRIDELDLQFRCKNCKASFYVNSGGKCLLGQAPEARSGRTCTSEG